MKRSFILCILCLFCACCSNKTSFIKHEEMEEYIKKECALEKNKEYNYFYVRIDDYYSNSRGYLDMFVGVCCSIMVLEQASDTYQSEYYPLYGKMVSICVPTRIKDEIFTKDVKQFDYKAYFEASEPEYYYTPHVSSRARININTWEITKNTKRNDPI